MTTRGLGVDGDSCRDHGTGNGVASVVGLRTVKAAKGGPNAADEAWRMYSEKITALAELQTRLLMGPFGLTPAVAARQSLRHYRRKVADNQRRLSRS